MTLLAALPAAVAGAQTANDAPLECIREPVDALRLACFDKKFGVQHGVPRQEQVAVAKDPYAVPVPAAKPEPLDGVVVSVRRRPRGEFEFTLDNQQVWLQTEPDARIDIEPGNAVRISPGVIGSFWAQIDRKYGTRVRRLR